MSKLFIPYITCGDPELSVTKRLVFGLVKSGADIIELGVPYSDPSADGETIQFAAERALKHNISLRDCCDLVRTLREEGCDIPIVLFTYFNPIFNMGIKVFAELASDCKVSSVLVVDLPLEEDHELRNELNKFKINLISIITPKTSIERMQQISKEATGFIYYVSRTGVTGATKSLSLTLEKELQKVRQYINLPIIVGFGISTLDHVREVAKVADGVVVGSALIDELFKNGERAMLGLVKQMAGSLRGFLC